MGEEFEQTKKHRKWIGNIEVACLITVCLSHFALSLLIVFVLTHEIINSKRFTFHFNIAK